MTERSPAPARRSRAAGGTRATRVTERDREILAFAAEHRFVLCAQVRTLMGVSTTFANRRLAGLVEKGLLVRERIVQEQASWYRITGTGLKLIESGLPPPRFDLHSYRHDTGLAWVWLAASRGAFGRVGRLVSEREMRSRDGVAQTDGEKFGVRLGTLGPRGRLGLHYPDLLLVGPAGERVAVELELSTKGSRRLEGILSAYAADPRISAVLYLVERPGVRRAVEAAAAGLGISHLVHVRPVAWQQAGAAGDAPQATRERARTGERTPGSRERVPDAMRRQARAGERTRGAPERAPPAATAVLGTPPRPPGRHRGEAMAR